MLDQRCYIMNGAVVRLTRTMRSPGVAAKWRQFGGMPVRTQARRPATPAVWLIFAGGKHDSAFTLKRAKERARRMVGAG